MSTSQQPTKKAQISSLPLYTIRTDGEGIADVLILKEGDIQMLFAALAIYRPAQEEEQQYATLLESLEEILLRAGN